MLTTQNPKRLKRAQEKDKSVDNCYRSRDSARLPTITIIPEDLVIECILYNSFSWFLCNKASLLLRNCVLIVLTSCIYLSLKTIPWRTFVNDPTSRNSIFHYKPFQITPRLQEIKLFPLSFVFLFIDKEYISSMTNFISILFRCNHQSFSSEWNSGIMFWWIWWTYSS